MEGKTQKQNKGKAPAPAPTAAATQPQKASTPAPASQPKPQKAQSSTAAVAAPATTPAPATAQPTTPNKGKKPQNQAAKPATPVATPEASASTEETGDIAKPSGEERDRRVDTLKSRIGSLEKDLGEIEDQIRGGFAVKSDNSEASNKRQEHIDAIKALRTKLKEKKTEKDAVQEQVDRIEEERNEMKHQRDVLVRELPSTREDKIDERIREMEFKYKSESHSLAEEKRLIAYLGVLKRSKDDVKKLVEIEEKIAVGLEATNVLVKQLKAKQAEIGRIRDAIQTQSDAIESLRSSTVSSESDKNALIKRRNTLKASIETLYTQIRAERDAFKAASNQYYDKLRESQKERQAQIDDRRKDNQKKRDDARNVVEQKNKEYFDKKREEERYRRDHPFDEQVQICDALIAYLQKLAPKPQAKAAAAAPQPQAQPQPQGKGKKGGAPAAAAQPQAHAQPPQQQQQQAQQAAPQRSERGDRSERSERSERPSSARGAPLKHPIEKFTAFSFVKVTLPSTADRIPEAIKALEKRKAEYAAGKPKDRKPKKDKKPTASTSEEGASTSAADADADAATESDSTPAPVEADAEKTVESAEVAATEVSTSA